MAITSASTQSDIVGQYLDNAGYDINNSVASCKLFIEACRALLVMHPSDWQHGQSRVMFDPKIWSQQLQRAISWLDVNSQSSTTSPGVAYYGVAEDFR